MYDRSKIAKLFTWTVYSNQFEDNGIFTPVFTVPFLADEMVIRQITYATATAAESESTYMIKANLPTSSSFLCSFTVGMTELNIHIPINRQPVQSVTFTIYDVPTAHSLEIALQGTLAITLEFVQYVSLEK